MERLTGILKERISLLFYRRAVRQLPGLVQQAFEDAIIKVKWWILTLRVFDKFEFRGVFERFENKQKESIFLLGVAERCPLCGIGLIIIKKYY